MTRWNHTRYHFAEGAHDAPGHAVSGAGSTQRPPPPERSGITLGIFNGFLLIVVALLTLFVAGFLVRVGYEVLLMGWRAL